MAELIKLKDTDAVASEAARRWLEIAQKAVAERGVFRVMLSGGRTPRVLYHLLAAEPLRSQAPWPQTHVFWVDERRVAASHPESNVRMTRVTLLDHVPIPPDQVHPIQGQGLANSIIGDYEKQIRKHFAIGGLEWPRFDLILLGMGADGHIGSIFPGTRAVSDLSNMVVVYEPPRIGEERITITLPVINNARHVIFLVTGEEKAAALAGVLKGPHQPSRYPAQAVEPKEGTATWLVDEAAASQVT